MNLIPGADAAQGEAGQKQDARKAAKAWGGASSGTCACISG
ncbi:hypothetical protein WJ973_00980 [Achromobacter xylosoxidans]